MQPAAGRATPFLLSSPIPPCTTPLSSEGKPSTPQSWHTPQNTVPVDPTPLRVWEAHRRRGENDAPRRESRVLHQSHRQWTIGPLNRSRPGPYPSKWDLPEQSPIISRTQKPQNYNLIIGLGKENNSIRPPKRRQLAVNLLVFENNSRDLILEGY